MTAADDLQATLRRIFQSVDVNGLAGSYSLTMHDHHYDHPVDARRATVSGGRF